MPQVELPILPEGVTQSTALLAFSKQDGRVIYLNGNMSVFVHDEEDLASFREYARIWGQQPLACCRKAVNNVSVGGNSAHATISLNP